VVVAVADSSDPPESPTTGPAPQAAGATPAPGGRPRSSGVQPPVGVAAGLLGPDAKLRRLARAALVASAIGWLAAALAVVATSPKGFVVTRWWAYAFAFLALNTLLAAAATVAGDALRHLLLGADHRVSTSKAQVAAWTYLVAFALCALMLMGKSVNCPPASATQAHCVQIRAPLAHAFDAFATTGLQPAYLVLLGLPTGAAVAAKAITTAKIGAAQDQGRAAAKTTATDTNRGLGDRVAELVNDDDGDTDLGDLQYQLFNLLTMAWFLFAFLPHPVNPHGLPDLPATLIGLTGVATAGYVTKKALEPSAAGDPGGSPS
jgi:hypothetical protein